MERFETLLNDYFKLDKPQTTGLPSVAYCANELYLSASYSGDLIKKETGRPAQEHIQTEVIEVAKEKIFDHSKSVSEIACESGFTYPQHLTRLFKQKVGQNCNRTVKTENENGGNNSYSTVNPVTLIQHLWLYGILIWH